MDRRITLGSLFDGVGGFPLCAAISGIVPIWAAEVDAAAVAVTKQNFPNMQHFFDVQKISGAELPPVDIITFGSPCQDVSVAGKRAGIKNESKGDEETTRSGLFFEAIRIIYEMRRATNGRYPTFIVWENVPGAFSSNKGNDFRTVLKEITKTDIPMPASGKWATAGVVRGGQFVPLGECLTLNIGEYPNEESVSTLSEVLEVIVPKKFYLSPTACEGILRRAENRGKELQPMLKQALEAVVSGKATQKCAEAAEILYSAGFHGQNSITAAGVELQDESVPTLTTKKNADVMYCVLGVDTYNQCTTGDKAKTLLAAHQDADGLPCAVYAIQGGATRNGDESGPQGAGVNENVCYTLDTINRHAVVFALDRASFNQGANALYDFEISDSGINSTIVAKGPSAVAYEINMDDFVEWIVRRLTPLECERLQGYPDNWTVLRKIEQMSDEEFEFWKKAYKISKEINGVKVKKEPTRQQLIKWYNKLDVDGTRYKQMGNSLAIPCALRVIGYIADYIREGENEE